MCARSVPSSFFFAFCRLCYTSLFSLTLASGQIGASLTLSASSSWPHYSPSHFLLPLFVFHFPQLSLHCSSPVHQGSWPVTARHLAPPSPPNEHFILNSHSLFLIPLFFPFTFSFLLSPIISPSFLFSLPANRPVIRHVEERTRDAGRFLYVLLQLILAFYSLTNFLNFSFGQNS